ncbi:MAG TPA: dihydroorotate dehydrogenase electron transfer subunit [Actinobacteria bacterium]|nr:dihydroorotate dehydrogenase electron transfer subunit [Actinomycetota bacterium]
MFQTTSRVVDKQEVSKNIFKLTLYAPRVARAAKPGQFVHLQCGENQSYILRRPFSVHQVIGADAFDILVRVVGEGTKWLAARRPKDSINLIGPLGRGYRVDQELKRAMIVAGGMGVAPLFFLTSKLAEDKVKVYTVMGAANRNQLLDFMDLKRLTRKMAVSTDDGSQGVKGLVTDILAKEIEEADPEVVFACGPGEMLKAVAGIAGRFGVSCQVSLEAYMACGVGACLGCVVGGKDSYLKVCADGPVFNTLELGW